ncbi:MAG: hypothetical protein MJ087_01320 [Lachnospiraceae bacterium]|nr:hypothetical protein [Lachnospiraceae bacterium]
MRSFFDDSYMPTGEGILLESKISVACGIIGWIIYALLVLFSYKHAGKAGLTIGLICWALIFDAIYGIVYAINALRQPGGKISVKLTGLLLNVSLIIWMASIFIRGMV